MAFATDQKDEMFTAKNLNDLYSRFDRKCFLALNGCSQLFITNPDITGEGLLPGQIYLGGNYGVIYQYRKDPSTCRRLGDVAVNQDFGSPIINNHDQSRAWSELSKLEVKHQDVAGGQVYVDKFGPFPVPFDCDITPIQFSFELLTREVDGKLYDVHLGWDPTSNLQTSFVSFSLGNSPRLPPSRIHKHKTAVADIFIEGYFEFSIKNTYQRYDCWRVHNCNASKLIVKLQSDSGSSISVIIEPSSCRSFRRSADGEWITTWPNGSACKYFFPYLAGDVPFFAGGPPPDANWVQQGFISINVSAYANNVANPFLLFAWQTMLYAQLDPRNQHNILSVYKGAYQDPLKDSTIIGNAIFTWGRAKVVKLKGGVKIQEYFKVFSGMETLVQDLENIGLTVTKAPGSLTINPKEQDTTVYIYPVDANIFTGVQALGFAWIITPAGLGVATTYGNLNTDVFDTIQTLRRQLMLDFGYYTGKTLVDSPAEVPESKVSKVTLTPLGLVCCGATAASLNFYYTQHKNYEEAARAFSDGSTNVYIQSRSLSEGQQSDQPIITDWYSTRFVSSVSTIIFHSTSAYYKKVMPLGGQAFVPPGGPWGFASMVSDPELSRVTNQPRGGADFWINKWGAAGGKDNEVRILGKPNQTLQTPIQTTTSAPAKVADDVFYSFDSPKMAGVAGYKEGYDNLAQINLRHTDQYFNLPYVAVGPIFHKIKKSAWLWNSLEWAVDAWTRSAPLCMGDKSAPLIGGFPLGSLYNPNGTLYKAYSDNSSGSIAFLISESIYSELLTNGILAYKQDATSTTPVRYWITPEELENYCKRFGFKSYNFDAYKLPSSHANYLTQDTIPYRSYSAGEKTDSVEYFRENVEFPNVPTRYYGSLRYVDLTA
jgi:hypothetical protein